jgi:ABC-type lipoprotein release transport system permease subunit
MSWRNLWRNRRRTLVTVAAMSLALFVEIHHTSFIEGYVVSMRRNVLELEMGDIQIFEETYRDDPSLYHVIEEPGALVERLQGAGLRGSPRLLGAALAAAGDASAGVSLRGVDPALDAEVSSVHTHVLEGEWLDAGAPHGVVLGRKLARTLGVGPGDEIVVLTQGADGSMANDLYTVRGVLKSIGEGVDRTGVYMIEEAFRTLMVMPEGAHQVIVSKPEGMTLEEATAAASGLAAGLEVKSWRELMPTIASMLDSVESVMFVVYLIIFMAIGIVILNAMLMAVFERIREFGVLKALGFGPSRVMRLIFAETAIQTALAIAAGSVASIPTIWYFSTHGIDMGKMGGMAIAGIAWDPVLRPIVSVSTYTNPAAALVVIVLVAILYPALKAAFIRPVEAIQHH